MRSWEKNPGGKDDLPKDSKKTNHWKAATVQPKKPFAEKNEPPSVEQSRADILDTAKDCVTRDRASEYGSVEDNFGLISFMWSAYLKAPVTPSDVAVLMSLLKIARIRSNPEHADNWVDLAGYAACGGELATRKDSKQ